MIWKGEQSMWEFQGTNPPNCNWLEIKDVGDGDGGGSDDGDGMVLVVVVMVIVLV